MFCKDDIKISLTNQIQAELSAGKKSADINSTFGYTVVDDIGTITIPQELIDEYWELNKPTNIQSDRIEEIYKNIKTNAAKEGIVKIGDAEGYRDKTGKTVKRITDIVKEFYKKKFGDTKAFTAEEQADNEVKAERGTQFHKDMENMFRLFIDPVTGKKTYTTQAEKDAIDITSFVPTMDLVPTFKDEYINIIGGYVKDKLDTYSPDARFLFETVVYNKGRNLTGTIDFIAIDGKGVDILDWKSIYKLSEDGRIYPTKKQGFNIQLNEYYDALKYSADLADQDFNQVRVIPVLPVKNWDGSITSLSIGKVKPVNDPISLLPVLSDKDIAYKGTIEKFLGSVRKILDRENVRVAREKGFKNAQDWELKAELEEAITQVVIQQNPEELFAFIDEILERSTKYIAKVKAYTADPKFATEQDRRPMEEMIRDASTAISGLQNFLTFSKENLAEYIKDDAGKSKVNNYVVELVNKKGEILETNSALVNKIAVSQGITGINKPQVEIGIIKKWTTFLRSNPATKAAQLFSKIYGKVANEITLQQEDAKFRFLEIRENLKKWGEKNNQKLEDIYKSFINESNFTLKGRIDFTKFREARDEAFKDIDAAAKFLEDNYDIPAYENALNQFLGEEFKRIDERTWSENNDRNNYLKKYKKDALTKKYSFQGLTAEKLEANKFIHSIDRVTGKYRFFKDSNWYSDFYKDLQKSPEKLAFYEHITDVLKRSRDTGLLPEGISHNFIPHVLKGMLETGPNFKAQRDRYLTSIGTDPNSHQFGNIDPITGLPDEKMFLPYTFDLSKNIEGKRDFSELSVDLSRVFGAFEQELISVENKQDMESLFILLRDLEEANSIINVNKFGNPQFIDKTKTKLSTSEKKRESENYKYLDKFGRLIIYGQNIQDLRDMLLPTPFKDKEGNRMHVSGVRVMQEMATVARAGAFGGLNIVAPLRNFVMGRISTIVQESPYFSSTLSFSNYVGFLDEMKFDTTDKKHNKIAASMAYFLPNLLPRGQYLNKLDMNSGWQVFTPENMMKLIQKSEEFVHIPIHLALMDNSTVRNGEIVNINQLVKKEFKDKYNTKDLEKYLYLLPKAQADTIRREIKTRTHELLKSDNLWNYMELSPEGVLAIKGVDRNSPSVHRLRDISADIASKATGSVNENNASLLSTSFMGKMLAMYRSWIPRTVQVRFGEMTQNNLDGGIQEGRMRSLIKTMVDNHEGKLKGFVKLLGGFVGIHDKKNVMETIHKLHKKKTAEMLAINKIDRPSQLSEEEFTQMYLNNIKSAYNDLRMTTGLLLIVGTGLVAAGEGDDDEDKNIKRTFARELSKYSQEFTFYYNPLDAYAIIKNPFPITNFHSNVALLMKELIKEPFDDEAKPGKYFLKINPLTNFFVSYLPLFDEELAKEWNISINPNYLFNR